MAEETEIKFRFTPKGRQISTAILAGKDKIEFTKAAASIDIHINDTDDDVANIIDLDNKKQIVDITDTIAVDNENNVVQIPIKFEKNKIVEDYQMNTIGIYCNYQGKEVLYAFGALKYPLFMNHTDDSSVLKVYTYITVGTVDNVVIKTNDAENITRDEFIEAMTGKASKQDLADAKKDLSGEIDKKVDQATYDNDMAGKANKDDVAKQISDAKGEAEKHADDQAKINDDNFKDLKQRVDDHDTALNDKASKQDVTDAENRANQHADSTAGTAENNAKSYTDEAIGRIPQTNLTNYYNKQEVDNKVDAAGKVKSVNGGTGDVKTGGTNLFIKSTLQHGWLDHNQTDNGGISNSEADYHTDYIYVAGKDSFTLTFYQPSDYLRNHYFNAQIDLCDGNRNWLASISTWAGNWIINDDKIYLPFSAVPNTVYIRVSVNYGNDDEMLNSHTKLEYGTVLTDWAPAPEDMVNNKDFNNFKRDNQNALNGKANTGDVYPRGDVDNLLSQKAPSYVDGHEVAHLMHNFMSLWGGDAEREPIINGNSTHFFDQVELVGRVLTNSGFFATDGNNYTFPIRKNDGSYSNEQLATALKLISEYAFSAQSTANSKPSRSDVNNSIRANNGSNSFNSAVQNTPIGWGRGLQDLLKESNTKAVNADSDLNNNIGRSKVVVNNNWLTHGGALDLIGRGLANAGWFTEDSNGGFFRFTQKNGSYAAGGISAIFEDLSDRIHDLENGASSYIGKSITLKKDAYVYKPVSSDLQQLNLADNPHMKVTAGSTVRISCLGNFWHRDDGTHENFFGVDYLNNNTSVNVYLKVEDVL